MTKMTREEALAFLRETVHTGHLATVRADGRPHVATIWYLLDEAGDESEIVFTTWHTSVKGMNIARTGYAALSVTDDTPPFTHVALDGPCAMVSDPAESRRWAAIIGGRYMGAERAEEFGARNGVPGEYVCRMKIAHISGMSRVTE